MLENLGFKKRTHVGISLSANNFIELVCVDKKTKEVVKYASGNIKYNGAIREIIDFDEFAEVLEGLFDDAGLNPKECSVTLNMPNVHFGITTMESISETSYIIENLQSEIEDLYIFKRNEPIISYSILDSEYGRNQKNIIYGAIQTKVIAKILEIFDALEIDLVRIDNSYSSLLKSIQFCDRFAKYVQKGEKTSILLITANSCCSFYLNDNVLVDCIEEPLAVKSFSTEEVYSTISKIADNSISKNRPQSLLIISETDEVNAELLSQRLEFEGEIDCINRCLNISDSFIEVSSAGSDVDANMIAYMTIEAVGAAVADYDDYPLNINFLPAERINPNLIQVGEYEVDLYRFLVVILGCALIAGILIGSLIVLIVNSQLDAMSDSNSASSRQINLFKKRLNDNSSVGKKSMIPIISHIIDNNKAVINVYNALSTEIPENIYIKKFVTNSQGGIGILGEAKSSESVDAFVKGLREKNDKKDLMLSKLSINSSDSKSNYRIPNGFTFEIKTTKTDIFLDNDGDNENIVIEGKKNNRKMRGQNNPNVLLPPPSPVI